MEGWSAAQTLRSSDQASMGQPPRYMYGLMLPYGIYVQIMGGPEPSTGRRPLVTDFFHPRSNVLSISCTPIVLQFQHGLQHSQEIRLRIS